MLTSKSNDVTANDRFRGMVAATGDSRDRWHLRTVPPALAHRYLDEGWWTDETLGDMIAAGLAVMDGKRFVVHSALRPWRGTIGEVDRTARHFAGWLAANGIGPGDVVVVQLPNWVEAATVFWGASYAGAIVVPVVHFYSSKELEYIVRVTEPSLVITADRFGTSDYLASYADMLGRGDRIWGVVGSTPAADLPEGSVPFESMLVADAVAGPVPVDPDSPAIIAFTSGTTRDPKGVIHSHRTLGFEARQLSGLAPAGGPPRSPAHRSGTSWECSVPSCAPWSSGARSTSSTCGTRRRCCAS